MMSNFTFSVIRATFFVGILSLFGFGAYLVGKTVGQRDLCQEQFIGEMHDGKCVAVTRSVIK